MAKHKDLTAAACRLVIALLLLAALAQLPACDEEEEEKEDYFAESFTYDGLTRSYLLHIPDQYDVSAATPVLVVLHGKDQSVSDIQYMTGFDDLADEEGFLVLYPEAYDGNWNDGRAVAGIAAYDLDIDDVGFVRACLERVSSVYNLDVTRLYICGFSNGAMMCQRIAFEAPQYYAAMAAVAGAIPLNVANAGTPALPIPVLAINGTDDTLVLWEGGVLSPEDPQGVILSVVNSALYWIDFNECGTLSEKVEYPNKEGVDCTTTTRYSYGPGLLDTCVQFFWVEGGGHAWPGTNLLTALNCQGNTSQDFSATEVIWEFFLGFTRPTS